MAQSGFTPIQLYFSTTAAATPSAGNLANGELAINITDGRLFYKDNGGTVRVLAGTGGSGVVAGSNTQVQFNNNGVFGASANMTFNGTRLTVADLADSGLTAGRVVYVGSGSALVDSAALTFDGTNLGLGTTSPPSGVRLAVTGASGSSSIIRMFANAQTTNGFEIGQGFATASDNIGYIWNNANAAMVFGTNATERARITSSGDLLVGTTTNGSSARAVVTAFNLGRPALSVNADFNQPGIIFNGGPAIRSDGSYLVVSTFGSSGDRTLYLNSGGSVSVNAQDVVVLSTGNAERARIHSGGSFSFLSTSISGSFSDTTPRCYITGSGESSSYLWHTSGSADFNFYMNRTNTGTNGYFLFGAGATATGSITTNGTNTAYNTSSDYRLKENIQPMTGALAKVAALKPVTYKWKADGSDGEGFIAHELAEVVPQCVTGEKDAVNEDGSIKLQGIDTSFLVATLTAAIQELKAEFDAYKASHP